MASTPTGGTGTSRWRPLLTALVWVAVAGAAFGGLQVWKAFLQPHHRVLLVEAEGDPLSSARSDAERVLMLTEIEFRAPDTGAALLRLAADGELPRRTELTVRGRALQRLVDEGRLEAWVHLGSSPRPGAEGRISAPLAPPRVQEAQLRYHLGLDDAVRILGRRVQTAIAVRDLVGLEVEGLSSQRAGELVADARRPGVYTVAVGLSHVLRAREDGIDLSLDVRHTSGREGVLRVPPQWLDGSGDGDRILRIEWTTDALAQADLPPSDPAEIASSAPERRELEPEPVQPATPDPARIEAQRRARTTSRIGELLGEGRAALAREDFAAAQLALARLGEIAGAESARSGLDAELQSARSAVRVREQREQTRDAVEHALAAGDFSAAEAQIDAAARAGVAPAQLESWREAIARGRVAASELAATSAREQDRQSILEALVHYERAHDELDVDLLYRVFPQYPAARRDIANTWKLYQAQDLSLELLGAIEIDGDRATVRCRRRIQYELKMGRHDPIPPDEIEIDLQRTSGGWQINRVERLR